MRFETHHYGDPSLLEPDACVDAYLNWHLDKFGTLSVIDESWEEMDSDLGDSYEFNTDTITEYVSIFEDDLVMAFHIELSIIYHGGPSKLTIDICPELMWDPKGENSDALYEFDPLIKTFDYWPDAKELRLGIKDLCDAFLAKAHNLKFKFDIYK
jgi:hypothetical protein